MLVLGLVLRSSFDSKQSSMLLSPQDISSSTILIKGIVGQNICDFLFMSSKAPNPPSLLVRYDDSSDTTHMFLHYNYTMFRSFWGSDIQMDDKIHIFRDMTSWLNDYNRTLKGAFQKEEDYLAWNIASFIDDGGEYHFDQ